MTIETYAHLEQRAIKRKGSRAMLESLLSKPLSAADIRAIPDDRWLAEFTKKVFQSGFVWRVVRNKWPDFEEVFFGFAIEKVLMMPDEMLEQKATNPAIIRNLNKVRTIRDNAYMISDIQDSHGSFGNFVADWDAHDITGLWEFLKKNGKRLGGNTGPYALRYLGVDTFLLSKDVEDYFTQHGIITGSARSKRSLKAIQDAFIEWQAQSGRSFTELSQIVALSCGDNYMGLQR
jgi:3-methyladenine DNA glycosylase Tag